MSEKMKISIITPSYNQAGYIERTILSIVDQSVSVPVEFIVVDGGSTDETCSILARYKDKVKWISEKDKGQSDALNKGIAMASGDIIGWLNSDDIYLPGSLQKVVDAFLSNPDAQWLYGMCRMIDENDKEVRSWITNYKKSRSMIFKFDRLLVENYISQPAVFFKKEAFLEAGSLDTELHYAMDYDLWLRLGKRSSPVVLKDYLASFRLHRSSKSVTNFKKLFDEQYAIHKKIDNRELLLVHHRIRIRLILVIYRFMETFRRSDLKLS